MKSIAKTPEGNYIVEMTQDEFGEFSKLQLAVEGITEPAMYHRGQPYYIDYNFTKAFEVVRAWWDTKLKINNMKAHLENMEESLGKCQKF